MGADISGRIHRTSILLIEPDRAIRALLRAHLEESKCRVLEADDGRAGQRIAEQVDSIDLLLTDVDVMVPAISGPELARNLRLRHPFLRVLYMSSHSLNSLLLEPPMLEHSFGFVQKPVELNLLSDWIYGISGGIATAEREDCKVRERHDSGKQVVFSSLLLVILLLLFAATSCDRSAANTTPELVRKSVADPQSSIRNDPGHDIIGWNGVMWGTARDQAAKMLSVYRVRRDPNREGELLIDGFQIQKIQYAVRLLFDETGLCRVVLHPTSNLHIPDFTFRVLREGLRDKYGPASQRETTREVDFRRIATNWVWQRPHGTVSLEYAVPFGGHKPMIGLIYAKKTILPEL